MMGSEDFAGETPRSFTKKPVNVCGSDSVEDEILRLLVWHKLLEVSSNRTVSAIHLEGLLPSHAVLSEKVKLDTLWEELDVLDPKRRGANSVSLILFLLITDPHGQVVDQVRDGGELPDLNIFRVKVLLDELTNIRKLPSKLLRIIILHLVPFLAQIRNIRRPDILPNLAQLVDPVGQPDRLVIMNDLLPVSRWDGSILREIQNRILRKYSWLPAATHRVTPTPHEYAWRFNHVVCKLSLRPIDDRVAVLFFQLKAELLSMSSHFLLQLFVRLEKLFFR